MQIKVPFTDHILPDDYGDNIPVTQKIHGINQLSFPFQVTDIPDKTLVLAGTLIDYDTIPFVGFPWLHWVFSDIEVHDKIVDIPRNASIQDNFPQGINSLRSPFQRIRKPDWPLLAGHGDLETHYAGPRPKSGIHTYRLTIYALSKKTNLTNGFTQADLMNQLDDKLLATTGYNLIYQRK